MAHKTQPDLSQLTVRQLRNRRRTLAREFPDVEGVIAGSLQSQRRRCGKEGCRCTRGELHGPYTYLSMRVGKRTRLLYVPADLAEEVERRVALSHRIEGSLAELSAINVELMLRGELD
jgi:Family of unknown function (DUF6788)